MLAHTTIFGLLSLLLDTTLSVTADFVIEIVSGDRTRDRSAKFNEYEAGGVGEYWILDPARNRAEFYLRDSAGVFRVQTPTVGADGRETYTCATDFRRGD